MTAHCIPKHIPKNGILFSLAYFAHKILPSIHNWSTDKKRVKNGIKVSEDFIYSSDNNSHWMPSKDLLIWIKENKSLIGKI